jgi:predicted transcriptional regulator
MIPVDVYILGDVTFRGEVVAKEYKAAVFIVKDIPVVGEVINFQQTPGGIVSKWRGHYHVSQVDVNCSSGFGDLQVSVRVFPVSDVA